MIQYFGNKIAYQLFHEGMCKGLPRPYWKRALHLLEVMDAVESLDDLKMKGFPPSIRLHPLTANRKGEWAIDIHKLSGWRITFRFIDHEFTDVKIEDYH
jgi:plasmid maintenance system killer protein